MIKAERTIIAFYTVQGRYGDDLSQWQLCKTREMVRFQVIFKVETKGVADELDVGNADQKRAVMNISQVLDPSSLMNGVVIN